jgi:hypothetical protein
MNRHAPRAAAARNRGRKPGYLHRVLAGGGLDHLVAGKRGVFVTAIEQDRWCARRRSRSPPPIRRQRDRGGRRTGARRNRPMLAGVPIQNDSGLSQGLAGHFEGGSQMEAY